MSDEILWWQVIAALLVDQESTTTRSPWEKENSSPVQIDSIVLVIILFYY
jgi:hypothetical protein